MIATKNLQFNTPAQARAYSVGLALVEKTLAGKRKPTAQEIEAATVARGRAEILKKFGSAFYAKTFGTAPAKPMAPPAKAASSTPARVKTYAPPAAPRQLTRHCYTTRGIFA